MKKTSGNRRRFHRVNFDGMVNLQFTDRSYECCHVKNLSLSGFFVLGDFQDQKLTKCSVRIFHKEKSGDNCLCASGEVVRRNAYGASLRFTGMTFQNYMLLMTALRNNTAHPARILRNFPENSPFEITGI